MRKFVILWLFAAGTLTAETGRDAWLRYPASASLPRVVAVAGDSPLLESARREILRAMTGARAVSGVPEASAVVLGTVPDLPAAWRLTEKLPADGFQLKTVRAGKAAYTVVTASNARGVLYGTFALLRKIQLGKPVDRLDETEVPYAPVRWVNEWNNLDGSIERGYGGRSIFWENGHVRDDLSRVNDYGRLLASLGINGATINNVNADRRAISAEFLPQVARIAAALRLWGVQIGLAVDFGSPKTLGGLDTFDPLDPQVVA